MRRAWHDHWPATALPGGYAGCGRATWPVLDVSYRLQVVFEDLKKHRLLFIKQCKINLAKYHMGTVSSSTQLQYFSIRGFFLGITAQALSYKLVPLPKPKIVAAPLLPSAAASSSSKDVPPAEGGGDVGVDVAAHGAHSLVQAAAIQDRGIGTNLCPQNQLHRAAIEFNDINNLYKQTQIARVLTPEQRYHSEQSVRLRSLDATIPWEPYNLA